MVWPLTLQRTVLLKKTIHAPAESVLALLQDPNVLFSLSPFAPKVTQDPNTPNSYTFTETLSFQGLFSYNTTAKCLFYPQENGVDCTVVAGFGTRLKICYRVKRLHADETEVSEDSIVESAFLTLPYVLKTFTFSHKSCLEALAVKAEGHPAGPVAFVVLIAIKSDRYLLVYTLMTAIQAVYIRGYEARSDPKPHTVYRIEIQAHVRSWQMWRRYSEFDDLHTELTKVVGSPPPASLPPKHKFAFIRSRTDTKLLEERRSGLESYLRAILSAKEDQWRESFPFKDFLGVPVSRQGIGPPTQFTASTWLDEHIELQTRIRAVRADINKRDALSDCGDIAGSHAANVAAKAKLAGLSTRISTLEKGLEDLGLSGMSEGELQRRTDLVARLRDDHEKLTRMVTVARQTSRPSAGTLNSPVPESDREALLGANVFKPITRVFGGQPKETEQTRPLDDHGIFTMQQVQMQEQDQQLAALSTILQRQKHLGMAISNEIGQQIEVLDDLSNEVDRVGGKLTATNRQLNRLG